MRGGNQNLSGSPNISFPVTAWGMSQTLLRRHFWLLVGAGGIGMLVLGFWGFITADWPNNKGEIDPLDAAYRTVQLFVLEGGHQQGEAVPWQLRIARFALPVIGGIFGIGVLLTVLTEQKTLIWLWIFDHPVVICGLGERGLLLARSQRERGERVVVVEMNPNNELLGECRRLGASVLIGDATDKEVLQRARVERARFLISVCGDDSTNAEVAIRAHELTLDRASGGLTCVVHILDSQLCTLLKRYEIGERHEDTFRLDCFNMFENGARALLREFPSFAERDVSKEKPHLLVVGVGRLGRTLIVQAARQWVATRQDPDVRLRVSVIDTQASDRIASLLARFPQLSEACVLVGIDLAVESGELDSANFLFDENGVCDVTRVYVCLSDDSLGMTAALKLYRILREHKIPIVVRMTRASGLAALLEQQHLADSASESIRGFGLLEETCDADLLLGGTYEILARATHEEYVGAQEQEGKLPDTNPAMVPWDELPETLKESNRDQSSHIGTKLRAIDCAIIPWADWDAASFQFTEAEIELLAEMEHERWDTERRREGWSYTQGPKDIDKKRSPYLVSWDELSEEVKGWDRVTIRGIPAFLARAELQVVRLTEQP